MDLPEAIDNDAAQGTPTPLPPTSNIAYAFLQSLAKKRDAGRGTVGWWIVFHFLLFPRLPFEYWLYCVDTTSGTPRDIDSTGPSTTDPPFTKTSLLRRLSGLLRHKRVPAILSFLSVVLVLVVYFLAKRSLPRLLPDGFTSALCWISFSIFCNTVTLLLISLFAFPSDAAASMLRRDLRHTLNENSLNLSNSLSNKLLEHVLWSHAKTGTLLKELATRDPGKRGKWFLVNFLAHVAEERIDVQKKPAGQIYVLGTGNNVWPVCRYSRFLATNMDHADNSILWLVDPNDFFGLLLPEFVRYFVACHAISAYGEMRPSASYTNRTKASVQSVFECYKHSPQTISVDKAAWATHYDFIVPAPIRDKNVDTDPEGSTNSTYERRWTEFHHYILPTIVRCGQVLRKHFGTTVTHEEVSKSFRFLSHNFLDHIFPHLMAFKKTHGIREKCRVLFMGFDMPSDHTLWQSWLKERVLQYWQANLHRWDTETRTAAKDSDVIREALGMFVDSCGGEDVFVARGYSRSEEGGRMHMDIGWYDGEFLVHARPAENAHSAIGLAGDNEDVCVNAGLQAGEAKPNSQWREIRWIYCCPNGTAAKGPQNEWKDDLNPTLKLAVTILDEAKAGPNIKSGIFSETVLSCAAEVLDSTDATSSP
ncbi:MAG: hypothetical protein KAV82_03490 [Phycisphaerae bacterium]|nr:hypothetical protein [Phycisphaerae bacterium]